MNPQDYEHFAASLDEDAGIENAINSVASYAHSTIVNGQFDEWNEPTPLPNALNTAEIETFTARLSRFTDKGMTIAESEVLADKLVIRDREQDGRNSCLECASLSRSGGWRCGNWQRAGVAIWARDTQVPSDLVHQLQWCDGFTNALHPGNLANNFGK